MKNYAVVTALSLKGKNNQNSHGNYRFFVVTLLSLKGKNNRFTHFNQIPIVVTALNWKGRKQNNWSLNIASVWIML